MKSLQALFGGTFNPVHYGHLKPVETLANLIGLTRVTIIPNNVPPHRPQPEANSVQRKHMLELAIADKPLFTLDERELKRNAPSYTAQTLKEWRQEQGPDVPLAFIIGQDSLLTFPTWYEYETILDNAHLIVCRRPGYPLEMAQPQYQQWLEDHLTHNPENFTFSLPVKFIWLKRRGLTSRRPSSANVCKTVNRVRIYCRNRY